VEEWGSGDSGSTYAVQHRCSAAQIQCSTTAMQHSAVQCNTMPHRIDHKDAMPGDIMVHLHDLMVEFDETKGPTSWLRRRLLPMFEAFGRKLESQGTTNLDDIMECWSMMCSAVYMDMFNDFLYLKSSNVEKKKGVKRGLENMLCINLKPWKLMRKADILKLQPKNVFQQTMKWKLEERFKDVQEFEEHNAVCLDNIMNMET